MPSTCIELRDFVFRWPGASQPLLRIPELAIISGERVLLRGPSGSGKSTLLSVLAGVHAADPEQVFVLGHDLGKLSQRQRDKLRANEIGYIFQQFNLLPYLSAWQNVVLAEKFAPARRKRLNSVSINHQQQALELLQQLGLAPDECHKPASSLSVGQQQRVAAARALFGAPALIIADEPTSALDTEHRDNFIRVLFDACAQHQTSLLFVTHDSSLSKHFDRTLELTQLNQVRGASTA